MSRVSVSLGDESPCLLSLFAHTSMPAHTCGEELITVSLLWGSEPTDPWVLFRPKRLVRGKGDLGSGNRERRKGAQEGCISQNRLRKRKPALKKWQERGKEESTSLLSLRLLGGQ